VYRPDDVQFTPAAPGVHNRKNLAAARAALLALGLSDDFVCNTLAKFPGLEHRLEFFHEWRGVAFYNDTCATIPQAAAACVEALGEGGRLVLVAGGMDKGLDYETFAAACAKCKAVFLLEGTGSEKLAALLDKAGVDYGGFFGGLDAALDAVAAVIASGDVVALSPGCTSFNMFKNEFDRGAQWKEAVKRRF
jgi:UDP-N-acetylmuramoylalanine--D-glutamate ligase